MDAKKSGLLSRFTLQIATAFFLFISVLLLTASFQGRVIFQGFNHVGVVNSSASIVSSWPFTFPAKPNSSANAFGVALGKVNSDRNGSLGSVRQNAPEGGRESNGSLPVTGIADAGEQNTTATTSSTEANRVEDVKQSIGDSYQNCDIFDGRWERDESKPYYPAGSCPHIDRDFDCNANGRPDSGFVKWRWQPNWCDVPRLNATDFLERLRGKKLVFVGDSLNRNMWESLVCILRHSISNKKKVHEISGKTEFKKKGFYAFLFERCLQDYNCTVDFVGSPFLVRESSFLSANGTVDTLRLDLMDKTTSMYHDADILVFNTGHWWTHEKTSKGENYYQEGDYVHKRLKVLEAYKRALKTWGRWVDRSIDTNRTHVFFRGYSVTHFKGGQWNSGGKCHKETEPIFNTTHLAKYPTKMKVLENVLHEMKTPVSYLNISRLTDHRKDGHPSIYRKKYDTPEELLAAERSQDCSHWCLPGVPDTWNELLYASMLKARIGS
ncbi:Protein trichome birefringence-like 2 [Linum perenne]